MKLDTRRGEARATLFTAASPLHTITRVQTFCITLDCYGRIPVIEGILLSIIFHLTIENLNQRFLSVSCIRRSEGRILFLVLPSLVLHYGDLRCGLLLDETIFYISTNGSTSAET